MKKRKLLVVGNWKMNPRTLKEAEKLFLEVQKGVKSGEIIIAPPFPFISDLHQLSRMKRIRLAAQDIFFETHGAYTGEVSLPMLKSVGVTASIVGHSERRERGESNAEIYKDIQTLVKHRTLAIVCVGEKTRNNDHRGDYFNAVETQLVAALKNLKPAELKYIVVAYEPVWAIGTGNDATPEDAGEMKLFIRKVLSDRFNRVAAAKVPILYGGSVNKQNAGALIEKGGVDGFLVGGASLKTKEFLAIIEEANHAIAGA